MDSLRDLPSVDKLLQTRTTAEMIASYGRPLTILAIQQTLEVYRNNYETSAEIPGDKDILANVDSTLKEWFSQSLLRVINASGVILHTNLGRAPLSNNSIDSIKSLVAGYCTLEYDLDQGARGSRSDHCEKLLTRLTGAEAALVVNNNASALFLIMTSLAKRKKVIISRTQLVEIGGGFRIADILAQSGVHLVEIGSTNRVHLDDYEEALKSKVEILLRAHHSNYKIFGYSSEPELGELTTLAKQYQTMVIDDLGSGALIDTRRYGLGHEPMVQESLMAGANLVCFSGDKLLGGPQAGIIVGDKILINKIKKHPISRVVRADKLCLAALSATLLHYMKDEAEREIPVWRMISLTPELLQARAANWKEVLQAGEVIKSFSTIGGGSLPEETLPTFVLAIKIDKPNNFLMKLRKMKPAIIGRIEDNKVVFDPRTVLQEEEGAFLVNVKNAIMAVTGKRKLA